MSRSRGAMRIRGDKDEILDLLARMRLTNPFPNIQIVLDTLVINELEDGRVLAGFDFEEWRWYAHIPDIACFVDFWEWCQTYVEEEPNSSLEGKFLRIGEEYHDVEEHEFGDMPYDLISFCRMCEAHELKPNNDLRSILESSQTQQGERQWRLTHGATRSSPTSRSASSSAGSSTTRRSRSRNAR